MADTHVLLIKCRTDIELIKLLPERIADEVLANNGRLVSLYWTVGAYDLVAIVELDSQFMPVLTLQTEAQFVSSVVAMRAFGPQEAQDALMRWVPSQSGGGIGR